MSTATAAIDEFNSRLSEYIRWSKKDQGPAVEDRARKVRFRLYRMFRAIAKTAAGLRSEIASLGYAVKRRTDPATGEPVSIKEEIRQRVRSLRFLSVSFLFRAWRYSRTGQTGRVDARSRSQKRIGRAILKTKEGLENPSVLLTSFLTGVSVQNERRHIAERALREDARDMAVYLQRKHLERLRASFNRTFPIAKIGAAT